MLTSLRAGMKPRWEWFVEDWELLKRLERLHGFAVGDRVVDFEGDEALVRGMTADGRVQLEWDCRRGVTVTPHPTYPALRRVVDSDEDDAQSDSHLS